MLTFVWAAAAMASTSSPSLVATAPWWERVTTTVSGGGSHQSCRYESSIAGLSSPTCEVAASAVAAAGKSHSQITKLTFERRFAPGGKPDMGDLQPGDKLLGTQVMAIAISQAGGVQGCQVLEASGDVLPAYGCNEVRAEKFEASAGRGGEAARRAYMTILVYGHVEQVA